MSKSKKGKFQANNEVVDELGTPLDIRKREKRSKRHQVRAALSNIRSMNDIDEDVLDELDEEE
jgi:hypothetical protein